jgi:hypothetical protein
MPTLTVNSRPRMPAMSVELSAQLSGTAPRPTMSFGLVCSIHFQRRGLQHSTSCHTGFLFLEGWQFITLSNEQYCASLAGIHSRNNWPDGPVKGLPDTSSSLAPGDSPMKYTPVSRARVGGILGVCTSALSRGHAGQPRRAKTGACRRVAMVGKGAPAGFTGAWRAFCFWKKNEIANPYRVTVQLVPLWLRVTVVPGGMVRAVLMSTAGGAGGLPCLASVLSHLPVASGRISRGYSFHGLRKVRLYLNLSQ